MATWIGRIVNEEIEQLLAGILRLEPKQPRGSERVELLLDTAAGTIAEKGIEGLTTSEVAQLSGSSIGVVYRYFPNIRSLLQSLALRNMRRYLAGLDAALPSSAENWLESIDIAIDHYVFMMRHEPGFRALRFGDLIEGRLLDRDVRRGGMLAQVFAAMLKAKYGFESSPELMFSLEVSVEISEALVNRAFLLDPEGDERFIRKAHAMVNAELSAVFAQA